MTSTTGSSNQAVQNLFGAVSIASPPTPPKTMSFNKPTTTWKSQHENDGLSKYGGRDLVGFGHKPPCPKWPGGAKLVRALLCFVVVDDGESSDK
jgi:hypothetical protein